jgi:hypothetical protein
MVGSAGGGQQWLWSSFPFGGYDCNSDPFNEPQFLGHELLHTFGYHHGDEMTRLQQLVEFKFALYRWYMLDHPETPLEIVQGTRQGDPAGPAPKK